MAAIASLQEIESSEFGTLFQDLNQFLDQPKEVEDLISETELTDLMNQVSDCDDMGYLKEWYIIAKGICD